jgi:hypothetical protein
VRAGHRVEKRWLVSGMRRPLGEAGILNLRSKTLIHHSWQGKSTWSEESFQGWTPLGPPTGAPQVVGMGDEGEGRHGFSVLEYLEKCRAKVEASPFRVGGSHPAEDAETWAVGSPCWWLKG